MLDIFLGKCCCSQVSICLSMTNLIPEDIFRSLILDNVPVISSATDTAQDFLAVMKFLYFCHSLYFTVV